MTRVARDRPRHRGAEQDISRPPSYRERRIARRRDLLLIGLFCILVAVFFAFFAATDGRWLTLLIGVNVGVGLTGASLYAAKVVRPGRYPFGGPNDGEP